MSRRSHSRADDDDKHSLAEYKDLYKEYKHDFKAKKRQCEELQENLEKEKAETKKAKQDTEDLWKIYHALQSELQTSYEMMSKVQKEKEALSKELDEVKPKNTPGVDGASDPASLKAALCALHKQKMDVQKQFNEIVLENKKLKEKETTYEPRIAEFSACSKKMEELTGVSTQLQKEITALKNELACSRFNKDVVEKYQRWNSLLMMETQQKAHRISRLETRSTTADKLQMTVLDLQQELEQNSRKETARYDQFRRNLGRVHQTAKTLRMQMLWTREELLTDILSTASFTNQSFDQLRSAVNRMALAAADSDSCVRLSAVKHQAVLDRIRACHRLLLTNQNGFGGGAAAGLSPQNLLQVVKNLESALGLLGTEPTIGEPVVSSSTSHGVPDDVPDRAVPDGPDSSGIPGLSVPADALAETAATDGSGVFRSMAQPLTQFLASASTSTAQPQQPQQHHPNAPPVKHQKIDFDQLIYGMASTNRADQNLTNYSQHNSFRSNNHHRSVVTSDASRINERVMQHHDQFDPAGAGDVYGANSNSNLQNYARPTNPNVNRLLPPPDVIDLDD